MNLRRKLPAAFTVSLASCSAPSDDYNCKLVNLPDAGYTTQFRDGGQVQDTTVCHAPDCNGFFDGGDGQVVYRAANGDQAPNCMV